MKQQSTNIYRNLMAVGLLGTAYRVGEEAELINDLIESTLQSPRQFRMCRAIVAAMAGNGAASRESLALQIEQNPDDEAALVAYAVTLLLAGDPEGRRIVDGILATSSDPDLRAAATKALEFETNDRFAMN